MGETKIQWTDRSVNPFRARLGGRVGHHCVKISKGCTHCYSSRMQPRFGMPSFDKVGERREAEHFLDPKPLLEVLRRRKPTKWFWCDMTDMFGEWVPDEWIAACFGVMAATPQHTHQILTKRPERALEWLDDMDPFMELAGHADEAIGQALTPRDAEKLYGHFDDVMGETDRTWPLPNVWLGTSVEDQPRADERVPLLLQCPAAIRFVSYEPALGFVDFRAVNDGSWYDREGATLYDALTGHAYYHDGEHGLGGGPKIDWLIAGGESGPGARPCNVDWIRSIVRQCKEAGTSVFVKQLGAYVTCTTLRDELGKWRKPLMPCFEGKPYRIRLRDRKGGDMSEWSRDLRVREFPCSDRKAVGELF